MIYSFVILVMVLGVCIGSFTAAQIFDIVHNKNSTPWKSSACHNCEHTIGLPYIIPIIGYILAHGKCIRCNTTIWKHFWKIELLYGLLFGTVALRTGLPVDMSVGLAFLSTAILMSMLLYIAIIDIFLHAFPVRGILYSLSIVIALEILQVQSLPMEHIIGAVALCGIFFGIYHITSHIYKREAMGTGDIYLAALIGGGLGIQLGLVSVYITFILGGILGVLLFFKNGTLKNIEIPFAPLLSLGAFIAYLVGEPLLTWYLSFF